jgi:hypothetical protein
MVALAAASPTYRRPAATSACVAVTLAALTGIRLQQDSRRDERVHGEPEGVGPQSAVAGLGRWRPCARVAGTYAVVAGSV